MIILLVFIIVYNIVSSASVSITHQEIVIETYKNSKSSNKQLSKLSKGALRSSVNHSKRLEVASQEKAKTLTTIADPPTVHVFVIYPLE